MKFNREVDNNQDIVDSRDVITRIEELESERDDWQETHELPDFQDPETSKENWKGEAWTDEQVTKWTEWDESDEGQELKALLNLQEQAEGYSDWKDGATLIRYSYFTEYCKELVKDIGDLPSNLPDYIESNINWAGVAEDLQVDYTSVEWDDVTYWIR